MWVLKRALNFDGTGDDISFLRKRMDRATPVNLTGNHNRMVQATQISLTDSLDLRELSLQDLEKQLISYDNISPRGSPEH